MFFKVTSKDVGHYGGSVALADYCPYIQVSVQNTRLFYICTIIFLCISRSLCLYSRLYRTFVCIQIQIFEIFSFMHLKYIHSSFLIIFDTLSLQCIIFVLLFVFFQLYNQRSSLGAATMWLCGAVTACMKRTNQVSLVTLF